MSMQLKMVEGTNVSAIHIDDRDTGLFVRQDKEGTVVYTINPYAERAMPHSRYALSHNTPASGVAGRCDFERDVRAFA